MNTQLDLTDIQGNIVKPYGRYSFITARYLLLKFNDGDCGRQFLHGLGPLLTSAVEWSDAPGGVPRPEATSNIAFTYAGMKAVEVPRASLQGFPAAFAMGMQARRDILGDDGPSAPENWDRVWHRHWDIHALITINGLTPAAVEARYSDICTLVGASRGGVEILTGHRGDAGDDMPYQDAQVVFENGRPTPKEHFGYTDGIGDPAFAGQQRDPEYCIGRGKLTRDGGWEPLATGEFLLGHLDEAREYPPAPGPRHLSLNGTFMAYRKLHENVGSFRRFIEEQSQGFDGSAELFAAKLSGRWRDNGAPVLRAPDDASKARWDAEFAAANPVKQQAMLRDFDFADDIDGARCPLGAHLRRVNPRMTLEFGVEDAFDTPGALVNRRRILRRGLPYGKVDDPYSDSGNHGIIFMALNADIQRQFEFLQEQWLNYGNDFKQGNDKEPLLGNHHARCPGQMTMPAPPGSGKPPHLVTGLPRLVETRGGEYFFVPSLSAIRMLAAGTVDPT